MYRNGYCSKKNNDKEETVYEVTDLIYHTLVMMANQGITPEDIEAELEKKSSKSAVILKNFIKWIKFIMAYKKWIIADADKEKASRFKRTI